MASFSKNVEERGHLHIVDGIDEATMENIMGGPPKIKNRTAIWPRNFTSGYLPKEKTTNSKRYMLPNVHCSIIYKPRCGGNLSV